MSRKFVPHAYQGLIIDHILDNPRNAVWAGMGLGKTVSTLTALDTLELIEPGPTLVLAPYLVAASTWPNELLKWDHLRALEISPVVGSEKERLAALKRDANVFTMNYENLPWLVETIGPGFKFNRIVSDESTRLKSLRIDMRVKKDGTHSHRKSGGGSRAFALAKQAFKANRFIELTGTPSPRGLIDLWGQMWFLDKGQRLGHSFSAFQGRWFQSIQLGDDAFAKKIVPWPHSQEEIQNKVKDLCMSLDAKDWFDLEDPIVTMREVELPAKARALYDRMETEFYMEVLGHGIEASNPGAKAMKLLQIASGAAYIDDKKNWVQIHDLKLQVLDSIIQEAAGMPILVAYHFASDLDRLKKAFPQGVAMSKNPKLIDDWNAGKIPLMFVHPESAGHGLNLQDGGNILVFFSHWWALESYQQVLERIGPTRQAQAGHKRPVFVYFIVATDTMDEVVIQNRNSKESIQSILMASAKRKLKCN